MVYCDNNERILEWGSEEMYVWYRSPIDNRPHRYFPDFYIKVLERAGVIIKYIIEMFLNYKLKFIFFKNYIINIIIGILMLINFVVYSLNTFYNFNYLKNTFFSLLVLHFIFQAKNYLSYFSKNKI